MKADENGLLKQAQKNITSAWEELVALYMEDAYDFCLKMPNNNYCLLGAGASVYAY